MYRHLLVLPQSSHLLNRERWEAVAATHHSEPSKHRPDHRLRELSRVCGERGVVIQVHAHLHLAAFRSSADVREVGVVQAIVVVGRRSQNMQAGLAEPGAAIHLLEQGGYGLVNCLNVTASRRGIQAPGEVCVVPDPGFECPRHSRVRSLLGRKERHQDVRPEREPIVNRVLHRGEAKAG
jgi:hypothetical protein